MLCIQSDDRNFQCQLKYHARHSAGNRRPVFNEVRRLPMRRSLAWLAVLVLAQATTEEFKEETEVRPKVQAPAPRDGYWAPPPGEAGASRHAPRPGPGDLAPADAEDDVPRIELDSRKGSDASP
ncbi:MAG: hypothetical protein ACREQJ_01855 [Candidatus Binatia bacterium]